ncbi:tyrosine-type recombinase/integrase [Candidatus Contubernalis alkaliaceticus]|uniref:tyrosine-type recombinase/integrase n=1 Tax=Candidatus Contubernalis alkaliaceticus TaxID=338645 RepID=UPI001F4BF605|nr:site-specific integrase [Candidatus Contubernalis alkalaceticus]UNC91663.1 site-specific integrase [Candidatus Contubernalis alkalaceticus]
MRGHLKKRGKHYTIVLYMGTGPGGKPEYKWFSATKILSQGRPANKKEAEAIMNDLIKKVNTGAYVVTEDMTVADYLKFWLTHAQTKVAHSTYSRYEGIVKRHLIPKLGDVKLGKLQAHHLQQMYNDLLKPGSRLDGRPGPLSPRSVRYIHATIRRALGQAVYPWKMLATNPSESLELPERKKKDMNVWEEPQVKRFLDFMKDNSYYALYFLAFATGMRQSEILGLRWRDVYLDIKALAVRQVLEYIGKSVQFKEPKSQKSRRTISLPSSVVNVLRSYQSEMQAKGEQTKKAAKARDENDLVFQTRCGTPINKRNLIRHFSDAQEALNRELVKEDQPLLPRLTFHEIRHTHATLLLKAGEPTKVVQERLGHANIGITSDLYSHVLPNMQAHAADKIQEMLFNN